MDEQKIPSCSQESGDLVLEEENRVLKPPPRRKKSLRKTKMEAENSRKMNTSCSGKAENEQLKTSLHDKMVKEEPLPMNVDNNNKNTAKLGGNLNEADTETLQFQAQQHSNDISENESRIPNSPAQTKSNSEVSEESKAGEMPEGLSGCKMTTIDEVSKIQKRNMKEDAIDELEEEEGHNKMGNKHGSLKSKAKNTETDNPDKAKLIQNGNTGITSSSNGHQTTKEAVVANENFEANFCLVEKVAKSDGENEAQNTTIDQDSRHKSLEAEGNSQSCRNSESSTSEISAPVSENLNNSNIENSDTQNNKFVNNSSSDLHENCTYDANILQVVSDFTSADKKETMHQLQNRDNNTASDNQEHKLQNNPSNLASELESHNNSILNFQNPLCRVHDSDIKTDDNIEIELTQQQCAADSTILNQESLSPKDSEKEIDRISSDTDKIDEDEKPLIPYQSLEDSPNQDTTCEGDLGDDEETSTDTDSDTYYSDFTSSEGEYDMEDAEKLCYTDDDKKKKNSPVSEEAEPESIEKILAAFQDTKTVTVTDDTDGDSHHGDSSHGDSSHRNEANTGLELSEDRAQSLKRKIGSFKVVKGVAPAIDKVDLKEASVGMATELVAMETDTTRDTTVAAELAILALHKEYKQKHAERKEREREKRKSQEVITRGKSSEKLEISRPRSITGEPRMRSRSTGDLQDKVKPRKLVKKQNSLPIRVSSSKLAELNFDERAELPLFGNDNKYPPGVWEGGIVSLLSHLEESRERRESGSPLFKPSSIKRESEPKMVAEMGSGDDRVSESKEKDATNFRTPSISLQKDQIPESAESEVPAQIGEATSLDLQEQSASAEEDLTIIIQVDNLLVEESPRIGRTLPTVREETSSSLESAGSFSSSSRGSSASQDKKPMAEESSRVGLGRVTECKNTPNIDGTKMKLENKELKNELWDKGSQIENNQSASSQTSLEGIDITTPITTQEGVSKQDQILSNSAPTTMTSLSQTPLNDGAMKKLNDSLDSVQRRQLKITRAKRKWLSQSAVVTSALPQSPTDVRLTSFRKNGEPDFPDSGASDLQISKSLDDKNTLAKETTKQVSFGVAHDVTQGDVTPGGVTPGTVTPGAVTPGAVTPGTVTPGAVTQGAVTQGAVTPGAVTPGTVTPGAVTPGAVTPGAVTQGDVTPGDVRQGDVTPKRPPRKGKLSPSASFAYPRTTRVDTDLKKAKRDNVNKGRREGGSRWQTLSGAIDADWLARLSSANKLPTEQMSDEIITLVTDAIPASFPSFPTDKRAQIALELYTTERTYVRGLEIVIELFKNQLEEYLEPKEKAAMFSNIDEIFKVNKDVLFSLCEKVNHWKDDQVIGDIFVDNGDRFKIYATYCNNYDAAENLIKQKVKKKKEFDDFLEACYKNVVCQPGLKLPAYLITVVQRIPRYLLLLRDLIKCTPASHPDARPIKEGLRKMNNIAEYINNQLQAVQGQRAMTELRSRVIGIKAFETAGKSLIKEGEVYIMSTKRTYKCLLFNDMVVFAAKNVNKRSEVELTLELESIWVADLDDNDPQTSKEDAIELYTPERSYTMYTGTRNEKKHWLQKLRTAIAIRLYGEMATDSDEIEHRKSAFTYKDGRIYCGTFVDAKRHGHGVLAWPNRTRYVGNFEDDERNGIGELTYSTGEKYNGEWLDDKQHGVGTLTYPNKDIYTGEWKRGKMNGKGLINFSNEDILDGEFVDNEVCGIARLNCVSGLTYEGTWKNSKKHGKGKLIKPNGDTYEGDFSNDRISGTGTMTYASNKAKYEGQWENNLRHGTGVYTAPDGTRYEGEWRGDHMSGRGKMLYPNGETYEGSWYRDMRFGKGIFCCQEGIYEGKFEYNVRHGFGLMRYKDKSEYEGEWQHDQRHGQGKMIYADSSVYEGSWMLGLRNGRGKMTFSNGATYEGNWDLGSEHGPDGVFIDTANNYSYEGGWEYGSKQGQGVERTSTGTYEGDFKANVRHGKGVETLRCGTVYEGHWRDNRKVGEVIRRTRWGETETTTELQYWKEGQLLNKDETIAPDLPFIQRITNK